MRIYVVGSGGIGGYFGGLLARAGRDVTFLARGPHLEALRAEGLRVRSAIGDFHIKSVQAVGDVAEIREPDLILFAVKTYSTEEVARSLAAVAGPGTTIIALQNGVDNDERIKALIPQARVYPGNALIVSHRPEPGVIEQEGGPRTLLFGDPVDPANRDLRGLATMFRDAGIDATASDDIRRDLWMKFVLIVAFGGMTALCRAPIGRVLRDPVARPLYDRCVREAIAVAMARHINLPGDVFDSVRARSEQYLATPAQEASKSSLLVDLEANGPTEIETINGVVARMGAELGIDVPVNALIYTAIDLASRRA